MQVLSLGRVDLPLGEALRVEMVDAGPRGEDIVHLQYYIATDAGPWALWLSCARADLAGHDAALRQILPPFTGESKDQPPTKRGDRAPFAPWEGDPT